MLIMTSWLQNSILVRIADLDSILWSVIFHSDYVRISRVNVFLFNVYGQMTEIMKQYLLFWKRIKKILKTTKLTLIHLKIHIQEVFYIKLQFQSQIVGQKITIYALLYVKKRIS